MGSWFLDKKQDTNQVQPVSSLRVQTSIQGRPKALIYGQTRSAPNIIWYGDFQSRAINDGASGGGKGGAATGSGGKGQQGSVSYNYSVSVMFGLCEGPINGVLTTWVNKAIATAAGAGGPPGPPGSGGNYQNLGFEIFTGAYTQNPWGYLTSAHPEAALNYRGLAYVAQAGLDLGSGTELPNYSFEISGFAANTVPGFPDANPRDVVADFLSNAHHGVPSWPAGRLASLDQYATYCQALGLLVSPALTDPVEASSFLSELFTATNSSPRWSSGQLDVIPWGDTAVAGNGVTFVPQVSPLYDLTNDDFLPMSGSGEGNQPIKSSRSPPNERLNAIRIEYLDRNSSYDPDIVDAKDQASIQQYGLQTSDVRRTHFFCLTASARLSAHLQLIRQAIPNTYTFMLPAKFILPDVEDILTLTRPEASLFRQPVRITEVSEDSTGNLIFEAEEFLGTAGAPLFGVQATMGHITNTNADPGDVNPPVMFEPTDALGGGLQVWAAVTGQSDIWGGCNVFASYDGVTFVYVDRVVGPARMGTLTAPLPAFPKNPVAQTIDQTNTAHVALALPGQELQSGTQTDAISLNTACYVDGEIIAYQTATLTAPGLYDLSYLVRGAFDTDSNVSHLAGAPFVRLDSQILQVPYDQNRVGATIYLKFQSFNVWGGGQQDVSSLSAYTHVLTGVALASPLPPVTNVRTVFEAGFIKIWWEEIEDFRIGIRYIIRKGDTFAGGQELGTLAHPPFVAFGAGTYWIMPTCQPLAGLIVYGENAESITIQGNMLTTNIVQTSDYQALGWPGTLTNVGREGVDPTALLRLVGSGNILADPDVLNNPDIINSGGDIVLNGIYEVSDVLDVGYVADCSVNITWGAAGIPVGANVLTDVDFLNNPDVLNAGSSAFVEVWVEVRTATTTANDLFSPSDMFSPTDMFDTGIAWGAWQRYVPGVYRAQFIQYRVVLQSIDPTIIAYLLGLIVQVTIPARIDHYIGNTVPAGGLTIVFMPDDAILSKPFNGGPLVGGTFNHPMPQVTMDWPGHAGVNYVIDAMSLSQMTFHLEDATGTHVTVSNVDTIVEGY